jgi:hypothetical protein
MQPQIWVSCPLNLPDGLRKTRSSRASSRRSGPARPARPQSCIFSFANPFGVGLSDEPDPRIVTHKQQQPGVRRCRAAGSGTGGAWVPALDHAVRRPLPLDELDHAEATRVRGWKRQHGLRGSDELLCLGWLAPSKAKRTRRCSQPVRQPQAFHVFFVVRIYWFFLIAGLLASCRPLHRPLPEHPEVQMHGREWICRCL